jgi:hypothetical protein
MASKFRKTLDQPRRNQGCFFLGRNRHQICGEQDSNLDGKSVHPHPCATELGSIPHVNEGSCDTFTTVVSAIMSKNLLNQVRVSIASHASVT